eukprot:COSAG01_NODE_12955_length_1657_cov_2.930680_2_plen_162_part_00
MSPFSAFWLLTTAYRVRVYTPADAEPEGDPTPTEAELHPQVAEDKADELQIEHELHLLKKAKAIKKILTPILWEDGKEPTAEQLQVFTKQLRDIELEVHGASDIRIIPDSFNCPITKSIMRDPVTTADGHSYEREAIQEWLQRNDTSPLTGAPLPRRSSAP